jgi:regulatory protein
MTEEQQFSRALSAALRYISYRQRSIFEVKNKLLQKHSIEVTERVLKRLEVISLLDDEKFAYQWIESRNKLKPKSATLICRELFKKGISAHILEKIVNSIDDDHNAHMAAIKFSRNKNSDGDNNFSIKLFNHLKRRGYNYPVIKKAIDLLKSENTNL